MNTDEILNRNIMYVEDIILKYDLQFTNEQLQAMTTVYMNFEGDWGFRVFGTTIEKSYEEITDDNGFPKYKATSHPQKWNVHNYLKKSVKRAKTQEAIYEVRADFIRLCLYLNQISIIKELIFDEDTNADDLAKVGLLKSLKLRADK